MKSLSSLLVVVFSLFILGSCNLFDDPEKEYTANEYIYAAFDEWYLWYDELPDVDPNDYESYSDLIDAISVEQDRWSFAGSYTEIKKLFESGAYSGFGAGFILDDDMKIKLTHVYDESPMGRLGAQRGWVVESVDGFTVDNLEKVNESLNSSEPVTFVFTNQEGETISQSMQKEEFTMNTVLHSQIYEYSSHTIGYLVFDSFVNASVDELTPVIDHFKAKGINDLIVDLRYNGGGVVDVATMLTGVIGGEKVANQVVASVVHNDKQSDNNSETVSEYEGTTFDLDRVYFITTENSASASELLINSLVPFMEVKLVGSQTHGKPVGMYVFSVEELDLAILPISFKNVNHDGYGDYYNGLPVDIYAVDDIDKNWGDPEEEMLKTALEAITNPATVATAALKSDGLPTKMVFPYKGINQIINAY